ncbi:MAG: hypothetical protein AB7E72_13420 [Lysobacterales bacterium]
MTKSSKSSGWKDIHGGQAFIIPVALLNHSNFRRLTPHAIKLLLDLARQYGGYNNGYLHAGWNRMRKDGWKSPTTLRSAMLELEHYGIISRTKQGGKNSPSLHGFTFRAINAIKGKPLDAPHSPTPSNEWLKEQPIFIAAGQKNRKVKRLVQPAHKISTDTELISTEFVQHANQESSTGTASEPVKAVDQAPLVQPVNTIKYMPCSASSEIVSTPSKARPSPPAQRETGAEADASSSQPQMPLMKRIRI